jgi:hypothetical protein
MAAASYSLLRAINHVFLPSQLPQEEDKGNIDSVILQAASDGLKAFKARPDHSQS